MNQKKIIFPTDLSPASRRGLDYAERLAKTFGAKLVIVHVETAPTAFGGGEMYIAPSAEDHEALEKMLAEVIPADPTIPWEHRLLCGEAATEIVNLADSEQPEMIIMTSHGRTGLFRLVLGSVAEAVLKRATCPVLVIKHPHAKA